MWRLSRQPVSIEFAEEFDRDLDCIKAQFHWMLLLRGWYCVSSFFLITSIFFLIYWVNFDLKGWQSEVTKRTVWILGSIAYQLLGIRRVSGPLCASWPVTTVTYFNLRKVLTMGPQALEVLCVCCFRFLLFQRQGFWSCCYILSFGLTAVMCPFPPFPIHCRSFLRVKVFISWSITRTHRKAIWS